MIKLICLGSRPRGRSSVFVDELGRMVAPGEAVPARDATWASIIAAKYPGCFRVEEEAPPPPVPETPPAPAIPKAKKAPQKDKILPSYEDKEFE